MTEGDDGLPRVEDLTLPLWARGAHSTGVGVGQTEYECQPLEVIKRSLVLFYRSLICPSEGG